MTWQGRHYDLCNDGGVSLKIMPEKLLEVRFISRQKKGQKKKKDN